MSYMLAAKAICGQDQSSLSWIFFLPKELKLFAVVKSPSILNIIQDDYAITGLKQILKEGPLQAMNAFKKALSVCPG